MTAPDRSQPPPHLDTCATLEVRIPVRGPSGRLYGYLDPRTMRMAFFDRRTRSEEVVDLRIYQRTTPGPDAQG